MPSSGSDDGLNIRGSSKKKNQMKGLQVHVNEVFWLSNVFSWRDLAELDLMCCLEYIA